MFMLIDCDNFFVSCERIFQPKLKNRPVVVLSNNDGCVVSRSYEAKALDIPMCCPFFKIENFFKRNNGIALSSNYELYADISRRVMALLRFRFGEIETYSIDEAFVKVSDRNNFFHACLQSPAGYPESDWHSGIHRHRKNQNLMQNSQQNRQKKLQALPAYNRTAAFGNSRGNRHSGYLGSGKTPRLPAALPRNIQRSGTGARPAENDSYRFRPPPGKNGAGTKSNALLGHRAAGNGQIPDFIGKL